MNYSKADLRHIVEGLIDELRECEDGTSYTTGELLEAAGFDLDEFDFKELVDIDRTVFRAAKANHITLDMSAHENKEEGTGVGEGLLYNLDFIVHNKKAQIKCPYCGSISTARIQYRCGKIEECRTERKRKCF